MNEFTRVMQDDEIELTDDEYLQLFELRNSTGLSSLHWVRDARLPAVSKAEALRAIGSIFGEIVYAVRLSDGLIKIGWTARPDARFRHYKAPTQIIAFAAGSRERELEIHHSLEGHQARGREYYFPHPEVFEIVNKLRAEVGRGPIAA